jgi:DNA-binding response OmpR family regulator
MNTCLLNDSTVAEYGDDPQRIAVAISLRSPKEVEIDLDLRLPRSGRAARGGVRVAAWLRADPANRFPIIGRSVVEKSFLHAADPVFATVFGSRSGPDRFVDRLRGSPSAVTAVLSEGEWQSAGAHAAQGLITELEPEFRHSFGMGLLAAVRLLLGAVRCGAVEPKLADAALSRLSDKPLSRPSQKRRWDESPLKTLTGWYLEAVRGQTVAQDIQPVEPIRRTVLLIDDQANSSGWDVVFREILGDGFQFAENWRDADDALSSQTFDFALVDLDLGDMDGLEVLGELRARHFDLPLIAFSQHDSAEMTMAALRAGADYYFAKQFADLRDRDSDGYFRRLARLVWNLPERDDPMRQVWRRFAEVETRLAAWEDDRTGDLFGDLRAADIFRMAYYFATARRPDEQGNALIDQRHRTLFADPRVAAQFCLHWSLLVLVGRALCLPDDRFELHHEMVNLKLWFALGTWDALKEVADPALRHKTKVRIAAIWPADAFKAVVDLMEELAGGKKKAGRPGIGPPPVERPHKPAGAEHGARRQAGFAALERAAMPAGRVTEPLRLILVDDQPQPWLDLLRGKCPAVDVRSVVPGERTLSAIGRQLPPESARMACTLLLDLDWGGGTAGRAIELLQQIKKRWHWLPVFIASAVNNSRDLHRTLYYGADDFFLLRDAAEHESAYLNAFLGKLERMAQLGGDRYRLRQVWSAIEGMERAAWKPEDSELAASCSVALRLAVFCYYPGHHPAEAWRVARLLGADPATDFESVTLRRLAFLLAFRALEDAWKPTPKDNDEYGTLFNIRTDAIKKASPPEESASGYLLRVARKIRELRCLRKG